MQQEKRKSETVSEPGTSFSSFPDNIWMKIESGLLKNDHTMFIVSHDTHTRRETDAWRRDAWKQNASREYVLPSGGEKQAFRSLDTTNISSFPAVCVSVLSVCSICMFCSVQLLCVVLPFILNRSNKATHNTQRTHTTSCCCIGSVRQEMERLASLSSFLFIHFLPHLLFQIKRL